MHSLRVIHQWTCASCGHAEEHTYPVPYSPLAGYGATPPPSLPDGWTLANGDAYCSRHRIRPWIKVTTERGPLEGNRIA